MKYRVMAVSASELAKANADSSYAPKEHEVGIIDAHDEKTAQFRLKMCIGTGVYPRGSQLIAVDDKS